MKGPQRKSSNDNVLPCIKNTCISMTNWLKKKKCGINVHETMIIKKKKKKKRTWTRSSNWIWEVIF